MKITVNRKANGADVSFQIDEAEDKKALAKAIAFAALDYCDLCKGTKVIWGQNKTKEGYIYIKRICINCKAQSTLGTYQDNAGYFWKQFEIYEGDKKDDKDDSDFTG